MKKIFLMIAMILILCTTFAFAKPFSVSAKMEKIDENSAKLKISFTIEKGNYLYRDQFKIEAPEGFKVTPENIPTAIRKKDPITGEITDVYKKDVTLTYLVKPGAEKPLEIKVYYQGCNAEMCFLPKMEAFTLQAGKAEILTPTPGPSPGKETPTTGKEEDWKTLAKDFNVTGDAVGYMPPKQFLAFLDKVESGEATPKNALQNKNIWLTIILILLGGLALNLTPCVLPMIPINLMIIGAGAQASSKRQGFFLGGMYGLGIALAYGILGTIVVLTGSKFGSLNSSPWFNLVIAIIFIILSLAMFDVFMIDFTKFSSKVNVGGEKSKGNYLIAIVLGAVSALLAGACVAPVVLSVLLLAGSLFAAGNFAGLLLPFLLGIGMAIPWPFAGAGMSFLPKPGMWMTRVKYVFGVLILLMAFYYGFISYKIFTYRAHQSPVVTAEGWTTSLPEGLKIAKKEGKPVFIDFWASWCKNCEAMEKTFEDPEVKKRLDSYVKIKYQAEKPNESPAKDVMDYYKAVGLPTYLILKEKEKSP